MKKLTEHERDEMNKRTKKDQEIMKAYGNMSSGVYAGIAFIIVIIVIFLIIFVTNII
jgi:hypothetical protein